MSWEILDIVMNFVRTSRNLLFSIVSILLNDNYVKEESEYKTEKPYDQAWEVLIVYLQYSNTNL